MTGIVDDHSIVSGGHILYDLAPGLQNAFAGSIFAGANGDFKALLAENIFHNLDIVQRAGKALKRAGYQQSALFWRHFEIVLGGL